jgi:hypothetical protein
MGISRFGGSIKGRLLVVHLTSPFYFQEIKIPAATRDRYLDSLDYLNNIALTAG